MMYFRHQVHKLIATGGTPSFQCILVPSDPIDNTLL
jgi:hypothetical protein